jgi:hypothetical protein
MTMRENIKIHGLLFFDSKSVGLIEVLSAAIEEKTDNDIEGISILNNNSQQGMAQSKLYATLCKVLKIR